MRLVHERWSRLRVIAAGQFGLFTAHQARTLRVRRYELTRAAAAGQLWRAHHGVYAFTDESAHKHPYEDWAAQWLALRPAADISVRRDNPDAVISHQSAAEILDLGTIVSHDILHLSGPRRINVRSRTVFTHQRPIGERGTDWQLVEGLPVTTAAKVIEDLAAAGVDGSHLGIAIEDALHRGLADVDDIHARLDPHASIWGARNGAELAQRLMMSAGRSSSNRFHATAFRNPNGR
ncbi:type IV toxin-antitoxin system AbiEi family antitoxin domain-containing protein [Mycobacteroides abscessus]|uniref:type IV toxin-antitoxin system AbiEi family antitoxin domain-containing protein n=1 Tax=Mycobacteroides abscessus TaxID=36809 RepID=UPI0009278943|nr:type IV toxin-antitoxin system AbiEi family antitoxin domain-containing protein [Mycobacteroides abscessus]SHX65634.1 Uncharacterised protein [Mycobacteroides abscessus subsp. abscessus]SHY16394.1 Uncharacterised protein [Mycobacteroides abscessus subsp. abscessus]SIB55705.1 Uncharacterised protein [Mycobacteroides abscessus subsp. abscessus]SIB95284.1 Uncharacterised protein [Mycobacteroides abscessus subsp. abscessus]SIC80060.1 Uncharacterised protein [Mycobacteroides abscessus subsp. abs